MNEVNLFIIEIIIGLSVSACVIFILKKPLTNVLIDICGTEVRAKFWVIYSSLMLVIAPLLTSIVFGKSNAEWLHRTDHLMQEGTARLLLLLKQLLYHCLKIKSRKKC